MDTLTTNLVATISKPSVGILGGAGGGLSWLLGWAAIITPLAACLGAVIGCVIAIFHAYFFFKNMWNTRKTKSEFICGNVDCAKRKPIE